MGLESATYINGLVETNPTSSDNANQGDNHIRLIKSAVKATFPNVTGPVTVTHTQLNAVGTKLDTTGGTMTGPLVLAGAPSADLQAATKAYVDAGLAGKANTSHTHVIGDVTGLQTALDNRLRVDISTQGLTETQKTNARTNLGITSTGTATNTDQIPEGTTNVYFTNTRARQALAAGTGITYDNTTGTISLSATGVVTSVNSKTGTVTLTTTDIGEGTNQYFTTARARSAISASGSLSYNSGTGVISFTDAVTSVAGKTGAVTLATSDVSGLDSALTGKLSTAGGTLAGALTISTGNLTISSGNINVTGTITASGDITAFSDARLKTNINTIENALHTLKQLRGVTYIAKLDAKEHVGVIAQEVERVMPQVVKTHSDSLKSVAYGNLVGLLIEAVKELANEVAELKANG